MRSINLLVGLALVLFSSGCTYDAYSDLSCSADSDCSAGGQCVDGLCVGPAAQVDMGPGEPANIVVTPASAELAPGESTTVSAEVTDADGTIIADASVVWVSDAPSVATVDAGTITAVTDGATTVTASLGALSAQVDVTVITPVANVAVMPTDVSLGVGTTEQITATATDADGNELLDRQVVWISQDGNVATVDQSGLIRGETVGTTIVTATVDDQTAEVAVEVTETLPASLEITPVDGRVSVATGATFEAVVYDDEGREIDQETLDGATWEWTNNDVSWDEHISFPPGIGWRFRFTPDAEEVGMGAFSVVMTLDEITLMDDVMVEVYIPEIDTVTTTPSMATDLLAGATLAATYEAIDEDGNVDMLRDPMWESSNTDVATVDSDGNVEAVAPGMATITVTVGEVSTSFDVTVEFYLETITAGEDHACGLTASGEAWCWGSNGSGQLGDDSTMDRNNPVKVVTTETFTTITAGAGVTCALNSNGDAFCWGSDTLIGDDAPDDKLVPTPVSGTHSFTSIASEFGTTCAVTSGQMPDIYCWGLGGSGQIGDGTSTSLDVPTRVEKPAGTTQWTAASTGDLHTCGVNQDAAILCWGDNGDNRLGNGTTDSSSTPSETDSNESFASVELGEKASCALSTAGKIFCWGDDAESATGTGAGGDVAVPTAVLGDQNWVDFDMGEEHVCAIEQNTNFVHCWGRRDNGRLGFTSPMDVSTPTAVPGMFAAKDVDLGADFSCAIDMSDIPFCWGQSGETPVRVWPIQ